MNLLHLVANSFYCGSNGITARVLLLAILVGSVASAADEDADSAKYEIEIAGYKFVPGEDDPPIANVWRRPEREADGDDLHMVQLQGATRQATIDRLSREGLEVVQYIHPYHLRCVGTKGRSRSGRPGR